MDPMPSFRLGNKPLVGTRSTAHIGPWNEIIFLRFHMHAAHAIPMGNIYLSIYNIYIYIQLEEALEGVVPLAKMCMYSS